VSPQESRQSSVSRDLQAKATFADLLDPLLDASPSRTWSAYLDQLLAELDTGDAAQERLASELYLAQDAFDRLMAVKATSDAGGEPTGAEWAAAFALLRLIRISRDLQAKATFADLLDPLLGPPSGDPWATYLDQLQADLQSSDDQVVEAAKQRLATELYLAQDAFDRLMAVKATSDAGGEPTDADWAAAFALLQLIRISTTLA